MVARSCRHHGGVTPRIGGGTMRPPPAGVCAHRVPLSSERRSRGARHRARARRHALPALRRPAEPTQGRDMTPDVRHETVLIVDDTPANLAVLVESLEACGYRVVVAQDGIEGIERAGVVRPDLILLDVRMPGLDGFETCERLKARDATRDIPVIFMTALEELGDKLRGFEVGGADYVTKPFAIAEVLARVGAHVRLRVLQRQLERANAELEERVARRTAELRVSQDFLQSIIDNSETLIIAKDLDGGYLLVNRRFEAVFHTSVAAIRGKTDFDLFPRERAESYRANDRRVIDAGQPVVSEEVMPQDDGSHTYITTSFPLHDADGRAFATCCIATDITDRKRLEEQFLQAQKMEGIGRLAGGIAHDFNNILTAIFGFADAIRQGLGPDDPLADDVDEIRAAAERAARLTRQLLIFARRNSVKPEAVDVNGLTVELAKLLARMIGENIELVVRTCPDLWAADVDPGQLEQVLVNLAVNARDAMPDGGRLTIATENVEIREPLANRQFSLPPGQYVRLTIADTGVGMGEEVRRHLFEPFFTTKERAKGTGLGLAPC